jgi:probable F420-dependent oxidoreductase
MKLIINLPYVDARHPERSDPNALMTVAQAVEKAGLHGVSVSDHPFPNLTTGGPSHSAWDPFSILSYLAAGTERIALAALVIVLPYRNPFLVASGARTLDRLSHGRLILGIGAGYHQPEFGALGIPYEQRNELVDEGLPAIKAAWTGRPVTATGTGWSATGNVLQPAPTARPHPPLWIGGNARRAMTRAAREGQGWIPVLKDRVRARETASAAAESLPALRERIVQLRALEREYERSEPLQVCLLRATTEWPTASPSAAVMQEVAELEDMGVGWVAFRPIANSTEEMCERVGEWGEAFGVPTARARG